MSKLKDRIQWQAVSGEEVTVGDVTLTPQSQALTIRWPNGGFVWNRPVSVLVERGGQTDEEDLGRVKDLFERTGFLVLVIVEDPVPGLESAFAVVVGESVSDGLPDKSVPDDADGAHGVSPRSSVQRSSGTS